MKKITHYCLALLPVLFMSLLTYKMAAQTQRKKYSEYLGANRQILYKPGNSWNVPDTLREIPFQQDTLTVQGKKVSTRKSYRLSFVLYGEPRATLWLLDTTAMAMTPNKIVIKLYWDGPTKDFYTKQKHIFINNFLNVGAYFKFVPGPNNTKYLFSPAYTFLIPNNVND